MLDRLENFLKRVQEIDELFSDPEVISNPDLVSKLAKERSDLLPIVNSYESLKIAKQELDDAKSLSNDNDPEVAEMALEEIERLGTEVESLDQELRNALLPKDPNDNKNVIMEIRGGTGGDEAAIFAGDLFRMYQRYAHKHGLTIDIVNMNETEQGGIKEVVCTIQGESAYRLLKHESGVHRVQRVPTTETQGRIHTSTATVAVLPEVDEVDVEELVVTSV